MQQQADLALRLTVHGIQRVLNKVAQHRHQHGDLLLVRAIRHQALFRQLKGKAALGGALHFTYQKAGDHRGFYAVLNIADVRLVAMGGLQHVLLEFAIAFHIQQAEDHVQFIHKFMGGGAQGIDIAHHTVQPLQQLADFGLIAEGTDGADHGLLAADRHRVAN